MKYWWVNHKQTHKEEIAGGFLWSPFKEKNGARSQFYDNMKISRPGELVISFANKKIGHIGIVQDYAIPFPQPKAFNVEENTWAGEGWLVPVKWQALSNRVIVQDNIDSIAPLLPYKYSPIRNTNGHGNQKAYLAEISQELFEEILKLSGSSLKETLPTIDVSPTERKQLEAELLDFSLEDDDLSNTQSKSKGNARRGQSKFRKNVELVESGCRITGVSDPRLLIASHIKPWSCCETATERLDGNNGFILTPTIDKLFDRGFISFENEGRVIVSKEISNGLLEALGFANIHNKNAGNFNLEQRRYLKYHRDHILK